MSRPRVVVAGMGDVGVLTAIHLHGKADVVGIDPAPGLISGQELGLQLARPQEWSDAYSVDYRRFRRLDGARMERGWAESLDVAAREIVVRDVDGLRTAVPFDALVIATGVANGFWRTAEARDEESLDGDLRRRHERIATAMSVAVVGGGATAVGAAAQVAARWPHMSVALYFPGDHALAEHHRRTWQTVRRRLDRLGVVSHPGHRAHPPVDVTPNALSTGPIRWQTGQADTDADVVLWAIGDVQPLTTWLPRDLVDDRGFVLVDEFLRVRRSSADAPAPVFAVGDAAATDRLRGSARNRADRLVAHNALAAVRGGRLRPYKPRRHRWGSVLGPQADGLQVYAPNGRAFRIPAPLVRTVLQPWIVERGIYGGIRPR